MSFFVFFLRVIFLFCRWMLWWNVIVISFMVILMVKNGVIV